MLKQVVVRMPAVCRGVEVDVSLMVLLGKEIDISLAVGTGQFLFAGQQQYALVIGNREVEQPGIQLFQLFPYGGLRGRRRPVPGDFRQVLRICFDKIAH